MPSANEDAGECHGADTDLIVKNPCRVKGAEPTG